MGGVTDITELHKPRSGRSPNVMEYLQGRKLDLVINDPETADHEVAPVASPQGATPQSPEDGGGAGGRDLSVTDGYLIRRTAIDFGVSLITNSKVASLLALSMERVKSFHIKAMEVRSRSLRRRGALCGTPASSPAPRPTHLSPPFAAGILYDHDCPRHSGLIRVH